MALLEQPNSPNLEWLLEKSTLYRLWTYWTFLKWQVHCLLSNILSVSAFVTLPSAKTTNRLNLKLLFCLVFSALYRHFHYLPTTIVQVTWWYCYTDIVCIHPCRQPVKLLSEKFQSPSLADLGRLLPRPVSLKLKNSWETFGQSREIFAKIL